MLKKNRQVFIYSGFRSARTSWSCVWGKCLNLNSCRPTLTGPTSSTTQLHTQWVGHHTFRWLLNVFEVTLLLLLVCIYSCWMSCFSFILPLGVAVGLWSHQRVWPELHWLIHRSKTLVSLFYSYIPNMLEMLYSYNHVINVSYSKSSTRLGLCNQIHYILIRHTSNLICDGAIW